MPQLGRQLVAQFWRYPDDSSLLELSTRVRPHDLQEESARLWTFLSELGFDVATKQETKAERTLAFFAPTHTAAIASNAGTCSPAARNDQRM